MKQVFAAMVFLLLSAPDGSAVNNDERTRQLARERDKLVRERNPVDRTKIDIRISDILLDDLSDSIHAGDLAMVEQRLDEYSQTIEDAQRALAGSGRNAQKQSGGFKDLEIALRKHVRQLEDLGKMLTIEQRKPLEKVRNFATGIRNGLLKALFP